MRSFSSSTCIASSSVPRVTQKGVGTPYKEDLLFDGLFSDNVPVFTDEQLMALPGDMTQTPAFAAIINDATTVIVQYSPT